LILPLDMLLPPGMSHLMSMNSPSIRACQHLLQMVLCLLFIIPNPMPTGVPTTSSRSSSSAPASNPTPTPPVSSLSHPSSQNDIHALPVSAAPRATASVSPHEPQQHPMLTRARAGIYKPNL
jgi:hypothetical protein